MRCRLRGEDRKDDGGREKTWAHTGDVLAILPEAGSKRMMILISLPLACGVKGSPPREIDGVLTTVAHRCSTFTV